MHQAIRLTVSLFAAALSLHRPVSAQEPNVLPCRIDLIDWAGRTLVARSKVAKQLQAFNLDLAKDPDVAWMHQNLWVRKSDYRNAKFSGTLCFVLITTRTPAQDDGGPALSLYLSLQPQTSGRLTGSGLSEVESVTSGDVTDATIPIDQAGRRLTYQQSFGGRGATSLGSVKLILRELSATVEPLFSLGSGLTACHRWWQATLLHTICDYPPDCVSVLPSTRGTAEAEPVKCRIV